VADTIGDRIRRIRQSKGLQQNQAARRIGVRPTELYRWEKNLVTPNTENVEKIARGLGVNVAALFEADVAPLGDKEEQEFAADLRRMAARAEEETRWAKKASGAARNEKDLLITALLYRCTYEVMADVVQGEEPHSLAWRGSDVVLNALTEFGDAVSGLSRATLARVEGTGALVELFEDTA